MLKGTTVEWERLEFKRGWNPEDILHSICAFANDFHNLGGGYIIVGIEERNGQPVLPPHGVNTSTIDEIQKELLSLGHNAIMPSYHPILFPVEIDTKIILVIWVPGGMTRPYKAKTTLGKGSEYKYYIRKNSSSVVAKGVDESELLSLAAFS
ncbi:MAG: ATP-dependent helicase RecG [Campylobacterota bacterium]|nr:ATP-dependent helicase RecG [Campylobacterota bacterium]